MWVIIGHWKETSVWANPKRIWSKRACRVFLLLWALPVIAKQLTNNKDCVNSGGSVHYLNKTIAHLDSYSKIHYRVVFFFGEGTRLDSWFAPLTSRLLLLLEQGHGYHYAFFRKSLQRWLFDKHCALFIRNIFPLVNHSFYHRNWARLRR